MKTKSKIFVASSLILVLALTIALICVSTMYTKGSNLIVGVDDIDDIASIKIKYCPCISESEDREVELNEEQIKRFAINMEGTLLTRIYDYYDGGGYNIVVSMKDGSKKELFFSGVGHIFYRNKNYECYSYLGAYIDGLFDGE